MKPPLRRAAAPMALAFALHLILTPAAFSAGDAPGWRFSDWLGFLSQLWAAGGCIIDSGGRCRDASTPAPRDGGCIIDPHGGCRDASAPAPRDEGCMIDPHGRCAN